MVRSPSVSLNELFFRLSAAFGFGFFLEKNPMVFEQIAPNQKKIEVEEGGCGPDRAHPNLLSPLLLSLSIPIRKQL